MVTTDQNSEFKKNGLDRRYLLYEKISENALTQSWRALNKLSGEICFLKISIPSSEISLEEARLFLSESTNIQKRLKVRSINTFQNSGRFKELYAVEYKWMDQSQWVALTPELFLESSSSNLIDICIILDYLHIMRVAHCDIKIDNFLINENAGKIVLSDLDFLKEFGSDLSAKIIGTLDHISNDVLKNKKISRNVDIYSFGSMLQKLCDSETFENRENDWWASYEKFLTELISKEGNRTSGNLLEGLRRCNLISNSKYLEAQKSVFSMQIFSEFCNNRKNLSTGRISFEKFFYGINRIIGLPEEFVGDLEISYNASRSGVFGLVRRLIAKASITRVQDFWHFDLADDSYLSLYNSISWCGYDSHFDIIDELISGRASDDKYEDYLQEIQEGTALKPFLLLSDKLNNVKSASEMKLPKKLLSLLVELSKALGRLNDAANYTRLLMIEYEDDTPEKLILIRNYARLLLAIGKPDQAKIEVQLGMNSGHTTTKEYCNLSFLLSNLDILEGNYKEGVDSAQKTLSIAEDLECSEAIAIGTTVLGIANHIQGKHQEARRYYEFVLSMCKKLDLKEASISPTLNMARLMFLMGLYSESIKTVNAGLELVHRREYISHISLQQSAFLSCVRLGQYSRAEIWLQKYLSSVQKCGNGTLLVSYYSHRGWLALNSGNSDIAGNALNRARDLIGSDCSPVLSGSIFQYIAELEFYRGNIKKLEENYCRSRSIYDSIGDTASIAEIELIHCIGQMLFNDSKNEDCYWEAMDDLWKNQCLHYFSLGMFFAGIYLPKEIISKQLVKYDGFYEMLIEKQAPLFRVCNLLFTAEEKSIDDLDSSIRKLKKIFQTLDSTGLMFWAGLVCTKIGRLYGESGQRSLYRKFLTHSIDIFSGVCNELFVDRLNSELQDIKTMGTKKFWNNINRFTELISKIHEYDNALMDIINLAVEETGAERGILMVKSPESGKLVVKAHVNFDKKDVSDAIKLSQNITLQAFHDALPVTISNATQDSRTMHNKSVIKYNIKSVVCMPLIFEGSQYGVLYLDHHTIPALFDDQEIEMVASLSKIISLILGISTNYHSVHVISNEITQHGLGNKSGDICIYNSKVMHNLFSQLGDAARSNASILLVGESGTGKDVICREIHAKSLRSKKQLVKLNCAALPQDLVDSELFGVRKGVATGVDARKGKFAAADGGTLFLDEIGDMPLEVQAKILRVIEYQEYEEIGSLRTKYVDIRFIYATNKDLKRLIKEGKFREDLFYRINTVTIKVPPLRERIDDIRALIEHFTELFAITASSKPKYSKPCMTKFENYRWPGNVRELRNVVERLCLLYPGKVITPDILPEEINSVSSKKKKYSEYNDEAEKQKIVDLLSENNWNRSMVAKSLNIPLSTFRRKLKEYNIEK